jgi:phospholipase C
MNDWGLRERAVALLGLLTALLTMASMAHGQSVFINGCTTTMGTDSSETGGDRRTGGPYGLGIRVLMIVVSPWSKGVVCSEVFDHTSLIRFIERRFGPGHRT